MRAGGYTPYYKALEAETMAQLTPLDDAVSQFEPGSHVVEVSYVESGRIRFKGVGGRTISAREAPLRLGEKVRIEVRWGAGVRLFRNGAGDIVILARSGELLGSHNQLRTAREQMRNQGLVSAQLEVYAYQVIREGETTMRKEIK